MEEKQSARRVLVCGGRDYHDRQSLFEAMDAVVVRLCKDGLPAVCHGDAPGADRLADLWAKSRGCQVTAFPAEWKALGRSAGPKRNSKMLREFNPDLVVAFPGGIGTADMVAKAKRAGVMVVFPQGFSDGKEGGEEGQ